MIERKTKNCKGTGVALGYGCGKPNTKRTYGLGLECRCYQNWLFNAPEAEEKRNKFLSFNAKKVENNKNKEHIEAKKAIKTKSQHQKDLQTLINSIVRLIDHDKGCISCTHGWESSWTRQAHAGHRISVGSDSSLRFNVHNIFKQCSICNNWKSGNEREYDKGLIIHYNHETLELVQSLKSLYPSLKLSIPELQESIKQAKIVKKIILDGESLTREEINNLIGIY